MECVGVDVEIRARGFLGRVTGCCFLLGEALVCR
ncbi:hypothetical protein CsSME_00011553 [Camellia sinensis var. sinensis]